MVSKPHIFTIISILLLSVGGFFTWKLYTNRTNQSQMQSVEMPEDISSEPAGPNIIEGKVITLNEITFVQPDDFGLATDKSQMPNNSVIPPCDENFNDCLFYKGIAYDGTNFQSAGVRIYERKDLDAKDLCLVTRPDGYKDIMSNEARGDGYWISYFGGINDAAAGSSSTGEVLRLFTGSNCYEFQTRIAQSQYANYEPGTIKEFTGEQSIEIQNKMADIVKSVRITAKGDTVIFE